MAASKAILGGLIAVGILSVAAGPATAPTGPASVKVDVKGGKTITLSLDAIAKLPHEEITATEHDGTVAKFSGVPLGKILEQAGAPLGEEKLRGKNMAMYVVVEGADGYKAIFSLAEVDPGFGDRHILLADRRNGVALSTRAGPLQMIVPQDKRQGRWVRMVAALHVRQAD